MDDNASQIPPELQAARKACVGTDEELIQMGKAMLTRLSAYVCYRVGPDIYSTQDIKTALLQIIKGLLPVSCKTTDVEQVCVRLIDKLFRILEEQELIYACGDHYHITADGFTLGAMYHLNQIPKFPNDNLA